MCRYFLSSLMLANTENVEISSGEEDQTTAPLEGTLDRLTLAMDQFTLSLLSTTRHHEQLSDFQVRRGYVQCFCSDVIYQLCVMQAASQQGPSSSRHQAKRPRAPDSPPRPESQGDQQQGSPFRVPAPPQGKRGRKKT